MWNILIGIIFIIGGLSGQMALRGTSSTGGLAVVGVGLVGWGIFQMMGSKGGSPRKTKARTPPTRPTRPTNKSRDRR
jgi:hypothetical protein